MIQLNVDIDRVATGIARNTARGMKPKLLYPPSPDNELTEQEAEAMRALGNIPHLESALKKILADATARVAFGFLNYLDGTGDPSSKSGKWSGVALIDHPHTGDPYEMMLHDAFYDAYWDAKAMIGKSE